MTCLSSQPPCGACAQGLGCAYDYGYGRTGGYITPEGRHDTPLPCRGYGKRCARCGGALAGLVSCQDCGYDKYGTPSLLPRSHEYGTGTLGEPMGWMRHLPTVITDEHGRVVPSRPRFPRLSPLVKARVFFVMRLVLALLTAYVWPLFTAIAVTSDWTAIFVPLGLTAIAAGYWKMTKKIFPFPPPEGLRARGLIVHHRSHP